MRRPARRRIRVERLEDRTTPAFVSAPAVPVGPGGGAGSEPVALVVGDFNRDGHPDVATANSGADGISVLIGNPLGGFKPAVNVSIGHPPVGLTAVDINGDGKLDLVTTNHNKFNGNDDSVTVLLGNGAGGFSVAGTVAPPSGSKPVAVAAGDFNGDGHVDLAVCDNGSSQLTILTGDGKGHFTSSATLAVGHGDSPTAVTVGDFNGDGHPDLASVAGGFGHLDINLNNGDGTFAAAANYATGFCANDVVTGDFNHDGKVDLAVACVRPSNNGVSVLLGNGTGTFPTFTNYDAGGQTPKTVVAADMNGDGYLDLVTANDQFGNNSVSVLLNNRDETFGPATFYAANQGPVDVGVGDFNGDGRADVVAVGTGKPVGTSGEIGTVATLFGNGDGTLSSAPDRHVGDGPGAQVVADFAGDGKPDVAVVVTDVNYNGVTILPNLGNGQFGPGLQTAQVNQPTGVATGDFNGDGKPDLAVSTATGVSIFLGNGDGTFGAPTAYADANKPVWVAATDFNDDGVPDLALADSKGGCPGATVLLGNGDGTFGTPTTVAAGGPATHLAAADFNHDGRADLAVVNVQTPSGDPGDTLTVLFGQSDGSFVLSKSYPTYHSPDSVTVGDFNGDGKPDLAVTSFFGSVAAQSGLTIFLGSGSGKFTVKSSYTTDSLPIGAYVADFNGDGKLDVATVNEFGDTVNVFPGTGAGTFGRPTSYVVGSYPTWGSVADFTGDGKPDLVVSNSNAGSITELATPAPAVGFDVTVAPTGKAGQKVFVTVTAVDAAGHLVPGYTGPVSLTADGKAVLPAAFKFSATNHGTHKFVVTLDTAGSRTVAAHAGGMTGNATIQVSAATATHLGISVGPTQTAGSPFDLTVSALDPYGNPDPSFAGTIHLTTTDPNLNATIPADYTFIGTDAGSHTFTGGMTLLTANGRVTTVTATAVGTKWLARANLNVVVGALHDFKMSGIPTSILAGGAHAFTVVAEDAFGNVVTNYTGTVNFGNAGGTATLPPSYTFTAANKGKHKFNVTFTTPGADQSLTVTDANDSSITGSETGITVN